MIGEQDFRQKIAAFDLEEATIALEILFLKYPNQYFNQLVIGFKDLKEDYAATRSIVDARENYIRMATGEIAIPTTSELSDEDEDDDFDQYMNPPTFPDDEFDNDPFKSRITNDVGEPVDLNIPTFLKEKHK